LRRIEKQKTKTSAKPFSYRFTKRKRAARFFYFLFWCAASRFLSGYFVNRTRQRFMHNLVRKKLPLKKINGVKTKPNANKLMPAEGEQASQYARSLMEASLDPLVIISPEGKITDVNEAAVK